MVCSGEVVVVTVIVVEAAWGLPGDCLGVAWGFSGSCLWGCLGAAWEIIMYSVYCIMYDV